MLWVLNQSDGLNSLLDICKKSNMSFDLIRNAAHALADKNLLREAD
jgi:aminopeptidase-like protein